MRRAFGTYFRAVCTRSIFTMIAAFFIFVSHVTRADAASDLCDKAARIASRDTGVPLTVLRAVTRTETGRGNGGALSPWPWTVNMEGQGVWFDSLDEAKAYVFRHFKSGARSFDVGCFQINYRWHGTGFRSIDEMFDPLANALYAARFLRDLHAETGNWTKAAGAFHSRTAVHARRYEARFSAIHAALDAEPDTAITSRPKPVGNRFPLLQSGSSRGGFGSLMPQSSRSGQSFIDLGSQERG